MRQKYHKIHGTLKNCKLKKIQIFFKLKKLKIGFKKQPALKKPVRNLKRI